MERGKMEMVVVVLGLLAMAQQSMQLSLKNPLPLLPRNMRTDEPLVFGLVTTSTVVEKALNESGFFATSSYVDLYGRRFFSGRIWAANVVYVRSSESPSVHVGITVQILADNFNLGGVVYVGLAGATNETLSLGTVSVPIKVGFTGSWEWLSKDSNVVGQLDIGKFNYPENGENLLGSIKYDEIDIYYKGKIIESFWVYPADHWWLMYASRVRIDSGEVILGLNSSSSDIYVNNPAYREFIFKTFHAATVDISSASAGLGAKSNGVRFIAFQGVANYAGAGSSSSSETQLASENVVKAAINFFYQATIPRSAHDTVDM